MENGRMEGDVESRREGKRWRCSGGGKKRSLSLSLCLSLSLTHTLSFFLFLSHGDSDIHTLSLIFL